MKHSGLILRQIIVVLILLSINVSAQESYKTVVGKITDKSLGDVLSFASVNVLNTNIATVSNTDGEFIIKIPSDLHSAVIQIQYVGYKDLQLPVSAIGDKKLKIELEPVSVELPEVSVISKDADALIEAMFAKRAENYSGQQSRLTAFYRETIKRNNSYASLAEAVVDVRKFPYTTYRHDKVAIFKARKQTDYQKVDTVMFKLMGGPYTSLYLDVMKYPDMIFTDEMFKKYDFNFERSTKLDKRLVYVISFKPKADVEEPLYYGQLFIDAQTTALKTAIFKLDLKNIEEATRMFVIRKPQNATVFPVETNYRVDFSESGGKWYFSYSRIELALKVDWKRRLFNTVFHSTIEMAVTNRTNNITDDVESENTQPLRQKAIIADEIKGFADPNFWGEFNVIEPEKPIEAIIHKIRRKMK